MPIKRKKKKQTQGIKVVYIQMKETKLALQLDYKTFSQRILEDTRRRSKPLTSRCKIYSLMILIY